MLSRVVVVAGVARSGTSWLGQILDSSPKVVYKFQPLFSYEFKGYLTHNSVKEEYENFFESLYKSNDDFLTQKDKRLSGQYPIFKKNNPDVLVFKENRYQYLFPKMISIIADLKFIGIIRHPCAVMNSWLKSPKEFPQDADIDLEWRFGACKNLGREEEFFGFYKWREIANLYLDLKDKFPDQVLILSYNDLVTNTGRETDKLFSFTGLEVTEQTLDFLKSCNSNHIETPYSVYRNKAVKDKWLQELPQKIANEIFNEVQGTRLEYYLK